MTRAALYARISNDDKRIPAIKNQLANLEKLARDNGYDVAATFSDDGISAYSGKRRPGFLALIEGVRRGDFDILLAVAEDRFTRSSKEKIGLQGDCVKAGVTWHTVAGGKVDPSTAEGGLLATITGAVAEYESAVKQERIRRSVADRLSKGQDIMGPRPCGFEPDRLTIREAEAEVIRSAYKLILEGGSVYGAAKLFTASGVKRDRAQDSAWRTQTVRHILLRERNCGRLVVKGTTYATDLPAIVDTATFDAVKAILTNPARAPRRGPKPTTWTAIGTVRCGVCGSYLSQSGAKKEGVRNIRCAPDGRPENSTGVRHPAMEAKALEGNLRAAVSFKLVTTRASDVALEKRPVADIQARIAELVRQRDLAQELLFEPGVNVDSLKKKIQTLGSKIDEAEKELYAAKSVDVAGNAKAQAHAAMDAMTAAAGGSFYWTPETSEEEAHARWEADDATDEEPAEWVEYWDALPIEDRRALVMALLPDVRLMPLKKRGQNRLKAEGFPARVVS